MADLLANQKPLKRRRPSFLIVRKKGRIQDYISSLWGMISDKAKNILARCLYIVRTNPLVPKIAGLSCLFLFIAGAVFLICFAVASPELPPENLISTLENVSTYYTSPENLQSQVAVLDSEEDWAIRRAFDDQEIGAGAQIQDRSRDIDYTIRPGETLSEIAYSYDIPYDFLAWYNKINNVNRIRVGTMVTIPSLENIKNAEDEFKRHQAKQSRTAAAAQSVKDIQISYEGRNNGDINGSGITVQFSIVNPPEGLRSFEWDLGDGRRSFRESPNYEYSSPKTYVVRLTAQGENEVIYRSNPLYIDIPHPASVEEHSTVKFITLSAPDDYFVVNGVITEVARYPNVAAAPLDLSESDEFLTKVRFHKPGYYGITVRGEDAREQYYSVFVSPIATIHADVELENFNWYRTQFNTGTSSNCGPASASMAIGWGTSKYFPVSSVRQAIGWQGDGGTNFEELLRVIKNQGVPASIMPLRNAKNIRDVIDAGNIAIILLHTSGIKSTRSDPSSELFGKYYNDSVGHYVVVKGYSMNDEYLVIHDPIPSDWGANSFRYGDEISMIGRNRYYLASEVLRSLRRTDMIVVSQSEN